MIGGGVLLLVLFLPLVFASVAGRVRLTKELGLARPTAGSGASGSFAIEDFDGDHHPDIAKVQTAQTSAANSSYLVQVQLSANGQRSLQVEAPSGGLTIEARDVNGDNAVDLVLTTALRHQPVAVFLNDGHGSFLVAAPDAFPGAFHGSNRRWGFASRQQTRVTGAPPPSRHSLGSESGRFCSGSREKDSFYRSDSAGCIIAFLSSNAERAPPFRSSRS
jgi:hypothetical protein